MIRMTRLSVAMIPWLILTSCDLDTVDPSTQFRGNGGKADQVTPRVTYRISGSAAGGGLHVDDDAVLYIGDNEVFRDWGNGANPIEIVFEAEAGQRAKLAFFDTVGYCRGHGEIWLSAQGVAPRKVGEGSQGAHCRYAADATS